MQKEAKRVSLGAVHTHTHTHTHTGIFRKIERVANEATLFGAQNRLFVVLMKEKNKVLEIACFSSSNFIEYSVKKLFYTRLITTSNLANQGGVE